MDILDLIINAFVLYAAFKLGEAFAYVKLAQGILTLKDQTKESIEKNRLIFIKPRIFIVFNRTNAPYIGFLKG